MDDSTADPDFVPPKVTLKDLSLDESFDSSDSSRSDRSRSLTPFLRSSCHQHRGACNEGHGIEFHSRISPSPHRSYHRKRRRRSFQISGDTSKDCSINRENQLQEMGDKESAADKEKTLQDYELAELREMAKPLITTSTPFDHRSLTDETFDSLEVNTSTTSSKTSYHNASKGRRNLMTEFSSDNIIASSPKKSTQIKVSSSSSSSSYSNENDQWVTKMLKEREKAERSYYFESNVSARSLTRKRFLETNKSPLLSSPSLQSQTSSSRKKTWSTATKKTTREVNKSFSSRNATISSETVYQESTPDSSFSIDTSNLSGSPRLKAFDGRRWIWSERTGYTYTMSPSYRNDWTPEREKLTTPMPHMARLPIHAYSDGEVSFQSPVLTNAKASRQLSFSSDEEAEEGDEFLKWTRKMTYGRRQRDNICHRTMIKIITFVNFLLWLILSPILYPLKLTYEGSKSCYRATKNIDFTSAPRYVYSIILSSSLSSANYISRLGHSAQNIVYVIFQEIKKTTIYVYKIFENLIRVTGHKLVCVWHRIKEEYCNFFNHDEEVKVSKNTTNINSNINETLSYEAKSPKYPEIKQKLSSMYTTSTQQFSKIYSSTSTLIYSSLRTLIGSVFVICKGTLLTLLIILTAPFYLLKECLMKIFTAIAMLMRRIRSQASVIHETDHATDPSKDTHAFSQHAETCFNIATNNAKHEPAFESLHNVMQLEKDKQQSNEQATTSAVNNNETKDESKPNHIKDIKNDSFTRLAAVGLMVNQTFTSLKNVLRSAIHYSHQITSVTIYSVLSVFSFLRIFGGCVSNSPQHGQSSSEPNNHATRSLLQIVSISMKTCIYPFQYVLLTLIQALLWPFKKILNNSTSSDISNLDEEESASDEQKSGCLEDLEDPVLIHEFVIRKVTTYIYNLSSLIWKRNLDEADKKKKVRFPDGLKTPKIVPGYSISNANENSGFHNTLEDYNISESCEENINPKAPASSRNEKDVNEETDVTSPLIFDNSSSQTHHQTLNSRNAFQKVSLLSKVVKFFSLTRKKRRKRKYFREGYRKSLRLRGLPAENDGLRDVKRRRIRRIIRKPSLTQIQKATVNHNGQPLQDPSQQITEDEFEYEEVSEDEESEDEEETIGILEWFYDRFVRVDDDDDYDESHDEVEETSLENNNEDTSLSNPKDDKWQIQTLSFFGKILMLPFTIVIETIITTKNIIKWMVLSLMANFRRINNKDKIDMRFLSEEHSTRHSLRLRGMQGRYEMGLDDSIRRRVKRNKASSGDESSTESCEKDVLADCDIPGDTKGDSRSLYDWLTTGWFRKQPTSELQRDTITNSDDNKDDGFYSEGDAGEMQNTVFRYEGLESLQAQSVTDNILMKASTNLQHNDSSEINRQARRVRHSQRVKINVSGKTKHEAEYEADVEASEEDDKLLPPEKHQLIPNLTNGPDKEHVSSNPFTDASKNSFRLSWISQKLATTLHLNGHHDDDLDTNHEEPLNHMDRNDLIKTKYPNSPSTHIAESEHSSPNSDTRQLLMLPFSYLWICLSSILSFLKYGLSLQFLPNKTIKKRRKTKTLSEEHPTRVSLRLRGFNAENEGIAQIKRTRQRKRNEEPPDFESLGKDTMNESVDTHNEILDNQEDLEEQVSFVYWAYCKLLGRITEDNVIDDDSTSIASFVNNSQQKKSLIRRAKNSINYIINGCSIGLWKFSALVLMPFQFMNYFLQAFLRLLQNVVTNSKKEKEENTDQNLLDSLYSDSEDEYPSQTESILEAKTSTAMPEMRRHAQILKILRASFTQIANMFSKLFKEIKQITQRLILRKKEAPERVSKRLRGVAPDKLDLPTTRRRSRRLSGSSVNSRISSRIEVPEPINEVLSSGEENIIEYRSISANGNEIHHENKIIYKFRDFANYVLTSIESILSSLLTSILSGLKFIAWPFLAIPSIASKFIHNVTRKGKVTVLHKEEHPSRLSRRLRGQPAETFGVKPNLRRRRVSKSLSATENDRESLIDESDIEEASVISLRTASSPQDQTKQTFLLEKCRNCLSFICSMLISPFYLAYFGLRGTSSQQSEHKKNRKTIRALREEFPSRQSLRLRGQEAENDGNLPTTKRMPRSRRSRLVDIQPLDSDEEDDINFDDSCSTVTSQDDESEKRRIIPFLTIIFLILPLVMWLCYGIFNRGVHAVVQDIASTTSFISEYSSRIISNSYHQARSAIQTLIGLVMTTSTSFTLGLCQIVEHAIGQVWSTSLIAWNGTQNVYQMLLGPNPFSLIQSIIINVSSNIMSLFCTAKESIGNGVIAIQAIMMQTTFGITNMLPSLDSLLLVPEYVWSNLLLLSAVPWYITSCLWQVALWTKDTVGLKSHNHSMQTSSFTNDDLIAALLKSKVLQDHVKQLAKKSSEEHNSDIELQIDASHARIVKKLEEMHAEITTQFDAKHNSVEDFKSLFGKKLKDLSTEVENIEGKIVTKQDEIERHINKNQNVVSKLHEEFDILRSNLKELKTSGEENDKEHEKIRFDLEEKLIRLEKNIKLLEDEIALLRIEAKKCCDQKAASISTLNTDIDSQILQLIEGAINNKTESIQNKTSTTITNEYVNKYLNESLDSAKQDFMIKAKKEMEAILHIKIKEHVESYINDYLLDNKYTNGDMIQEEFKVGINGSQVEEIVRNALVRYDADKTGIFDFALETSGGSVVSTRCTQTYVERSGTYTMFNGWLNLGWFSPLTMSTTSPRNAIQPGVQPGQCWAFKGSEGRLLISLSSPMIPRRFSIEHIPRSLSPNGRIDSAPRNFMVYGLMAEFDQQPVKLGEYEYDAIKGEPLQMFDVQLTEEKTKNFKLIEVEIKSNHGHPEYTCLYRFRVHGI